jgi:hypothetical protein
MEAPSPPGRGCHHPDPSWVVAFTCRWSCARRVDRHSAGGRRYWENPIRPGFAGSTVRRTQPSDPRRSTVPRRNEQRWTMARNSKSTPLFPVRGIPGGYRDPWSDDDTDTVRQGVVGSDAHTADVAARWQRERSERERREERKRKAGQAITTQ